MNKNRGVTGREWVLVGVDFSRAAQKALVVARAEAQRRDATLVILHVIDTHGMDDMARLAGVAEKDLRQRLGKERRERLAGLLSEVEAEGAEVPAELAIAWGSPFEEIIKRAADLGASLIVLGTSGRSADLEKALFGSTAEKVLRYAPCPVLCVPVD